MLRRFMESLRGPQSSPLEKSHECLSIYLEELDQILSDYDIDEVYLQCSDGSEILQADGNGSTRTIAWRREKMSEFLTELSWETRVRLDPFRPYGGGVLPQRPWRWHAITAPMSPGRPLLVLRRQRFDALTLDRFKFENSSPSDLIKQLNHGMSLVFFGATGSGKTSLMMALLKEYYLKTRVGLAEVVEEIPLLSNAWFRLVEVAPDTGGRGGVSMDRVVSEMMRLSPTVIAIGELRGAETQVFFDAARTGHGGVLTTLHAGSFDDAKRRLSRLSNLRYEDFPQICGIHVQRQGGLVTVTANQL